MKGKYAAKAANRVAALDNDIIEEMRSGAITIPLGATTGQRPPIPPTPRFPVIVKHFEPEPTQEKATHD